MAVDSPKPMSAWASDLSENRCWLGIKAEIRETMNGFRNEADQLEYGTEEHREKTYKARHYFEVLDFIDHKIQNSMKETKR